MNCGSVAAFGLALGLGAVLIGCSVGEDAEQKFETVEAP